MTNNKLQSLFQPIVIGDIELRNRIVMAPMGMAYAAKDGSINQRMIDYYAERARGGVGLIISETTCVDNPEGRGGLASELIIDKDSYIPGLRKLADAVHVHGSRMFTQLNHVGWYRYSRDSTVQPIAPSPVAPHLTGRTPHELTTPEVDELIEKFAQAAWRVKEAGLDGVELLSSTGYLISNFLSPVTNKRKDRFGGDTIEVRATFLLEIIRRIREMLGQEFPICCKLSVEEFMPGGNTIEDSKVLARLLEEAGASILHAWAGWHESSVPMLPGSVKQGAFVYLAEELKKVTSLPVAAVCRIVDPQLANQIIAEGRADLVVMGRALLADPYLPKKATAGDLDEIRMCIACCRCIDTMFNALLHGVDEQPVVCSLNAELGREGESRVKPTTAPRRVLIIGGGPAGMETARVAALRGHKVTLWETKGRLGGNLITAAVAPYKEELNNLIAYLPHQIAKLGVEVRLNKFATPEAIVEEGADEVVIATGGSPIIPDLPGINGKNVVTAVDVLNGESNVGDRVTIIGGGMVGCETAEFLASKGKQVTIIEMLPSIARDLGPTNRRFVVDRIRQADIRILTSTKVKQVTQTGVIVEQEGKTFTVEADSVVLAVGMDANNGLAKSLEGKVPGLHIVGDCAQPSKILEAIHAGWEVGCDL